MGREIVIKQISAGAAGSPHREDTVPDKLPQGILGGGCLRKSFVEGEKVPFKDQDVEPLRSCKYFISLVLAMNVDPSPWSCSPSMTIRDWPIALPMSSRSEKSVESTEMVRMGMVFCST
jgi:hypothetical protein